MGKTFAQINERIRNGEAVVVTAEEMIDVVADKGAERAARDVDVVTAVVSSINAVLRNRWTMLLWGILVSALTAVGFMTAMLGFVVIIPWLGYATWHGYREALDVSGWDTLPMPR